MLAIAATLAMLAAAVSHAATQLWPQEHAAPRDSPFAFANVDKLRRRRRRRRRRVGRSDKEEEKEKEDI